MPCCCAIPGFIQTALSQVIVVIGLGISWSQALLVQAPSQMVGSGRKFTSMPWAVTCAGAGGFAAGAAVGAAAVFGMRPSCTQVCQLVANSSRGFRVV